MIETVLTVGLLSVPYVALLAWATSKIYFNEKLKYNRAVMSELKED